MRRPGDAEAEAWILTTGPGQALLAEVACAAVPMAADVTRWRAHASAEHVAAAIRLVETRRRGASKFTRADRMWLRPHGPRTGHRRARRPPQSQALRLGSRVFDLCCGIGGDALAIAEVSEVVAVDLDHGMCRRTLWNASAYGVGERIAALQARAEAVPMPAGSWVHIDPDRRVRVLARAKTIAEYVPGLDFLKSLTDTADAGAIKLGPASDFAAHFDDDRHEVELVSLRGECKEATVWFGASRSCRRRATCLPSGATWTDRDGPADAYVPSEAVQAWVYDPDPALIRSGLLDAFAAVHGLCRFVPGVDYLTSDRLIDSPFLAAFEVVAVLPLDLKTIKRELAARGSGRLEIKTRGVDLRPEDLRRRLRVEGEERATLLLAGVAGLSRAVIAKWRNENAIL